MMLASTKSCQLRRTHGQVLTKIVSFCSQISWICANIEKFAQAHVIYLNFRKYVVWVYLFIFEGLLDKKSRLKMLTKLNVTGTELSDVSLRYVAQYLPQVSEKCDDCDSMTKIILFVILSQALYR